MLWKELLQTSAETLVAPWIGGRSLRTHQRAFKIEGDLPAEHGWHSFELSGRRARWTAGAERVDGALALDVHGYLIGDRLVPDDVRVAPKLAALAHSFERIHLIEPGLDRFARVSAGRAFEDGPLIYRTLELPLGPEEEVLREFLDGSDTADAIPGVSPALDAAFRVEVFRRKEAARRREERARQERLAEEQSEAEARQRELAERYGNAGGRRELAVHDFGDAARAALAIGGAEYLDHRPAHHADEMIVRFRFQRQRFECTCDRRTLRIIDAGICLTDHTTETRGDTRFTLESLPAVIRQAESEGVLVIFRHA
jgi:hypothetical protein